jgi:hypothetical protein
VVSVGANFSLANPFLGAVKMSRQKQLKPKYKRTSKHNKVRKYLNMDAMLSAITQGFTSIPDPRRGRVEIPLHDALMSGFAMFSLKDPSLLAFDERRCNDGNLKSIYGRKTIRQSLYS